ncbi:MAG TPA: DegV family protein [Dehalococcoidia bacterium]|nr:DegV family protein [Dehalococcoidia bacterium]
MTVKIVTDSTADLPASVIEELGINVVPLYVRFGEKIYRDQVDISHDEFYQKLQHGPVHPNTTQPTPQDFTEVYQRLAGEADGIVSVHISSKLSGTFNSAAQGKASVETKCPVEVIDSQVTTMGLGMLAILAAEAARDGKSLSEVVAVINDAIPNIHILFFVDTLKYLQLGGRIGKASALLGSILNVKPMLALKDGELLPAGNVRTRSKGARRLAEFVSSATNIEDIAVIYSTTPDEARALVESLDPIFSKEKITVARLGPVVGVHAGPGTLAVILRGNMPASNEPVAH